jgi:hypothetical protein
MSFKLVSVANEVKEASIDDDDEAFFLEVATIET